MELRRTEYIINKHPHLFYWFSIPQYFVFVSLQVRNTLSRMLLAVQSHLIPELLRKGQHQEPE